MSADSPIDPGVLRRSAGEIRWFHQMDLGHGIVTDGIYDPARTLPRLGLPERLDGHRVLDVGAWDGFYSFEAERRGAQVLATDEFSWDGDGWGTKAGFDLARSALGSNVESRHVDPMDLHPDVVGGSWDIVLLLGVLYHLREPIRALERVRSVCSGLLVLETEVGMLLTRRPAAEFYPGTELNRDPTNWWSPNVAAVTGMLQVAGFGEVSVAWQRRPSLRMLKWARRLPTSRRESFTQSMTTDRFVFHARV